MNRIRLGREQHKSNILLAIQLDQYQLDTSSSQHNIHSPPNTMRSSPLLVAAFAAALSAAAPLEKKSNYDTLPGGDIDILNYALTLEYLERKFYAEGLANFTERDFCAAGYDSDFYKNLKVIYEDEKVMYLGLLSDIEGIGRHRLT